MNGENIAAIVALLQARLEPVERAELLSDALEGVLPTARKAAVLLGLFAVEGEMHLLFIRRATTLRSHSGEIAFPGGGSELIDSSLVMTALREAQEEIGLDPSNVRDFRAIASCFHCCQQLPDCASGGLLARGIGYVAIATQ